MWSRSAGHTTSHSRTQSWGPENQAEYFAASRIILSSFGSKENNRNVFCKIFCLPHTRHRSRAPCSGGRALAPPHPRIHHHHCEHPPDPPPHEDHHDKYTRIRAQALWTAASPEERGVWSQCSAWSRKKVRKCIRILVCMLTSILICILICTSG